MKKNLTDREIEILYWVAEGLSNPEIAEKLMISIHTVKAHICSIIEKLNANGRVQASVIATKLNLI